MSSFTLLEARVLLAPFQATWNGQNAGNIDIQTAANWYPIGAPFNATSSILTFGEIDLPNIDPTQFTADFTTYLYVGTLNIQDNDFTLANPGHDSAIVSVNGFNQNMVLNYGWIGAGSTSPTTFNINVPIVLTALNNFDPTGGLVINHVSNHGTSDNSSLYLNELILGVSSEPANLIVNGPAGPSNWVYITNAGNSFGSLTIQNGAQVRAQLSGNIVLDDNFNSSLLGVDGGPITIASGATLEIISETGSITVARDFVLNGGNLLFQAAGSITFTGTVTVTGGSAGVVGGFSNNLTFSAGAPSTLTGTIEMDLTQGPQVNIMFSAENTNNLALFNFYSTLSFTCNGCTPMLEGITAMTIYIEQSTQVNLNSSKYKDSLGYGSFNPDLLPNLTIEDGGTLFFFSTSTVSETKYYFGILHVNNGGNLIFNNYDPSTNTVTAYQTNIYFSIGSTGSNDWSAYPWTGGLGIFYWQTGLPGSTATPINFKEGLSENQLNLISWFDPLTLAGGIYQVSGADFPGNSAIWIPCTVSSSGGNISPGNCAFEGTPNFDQDMNSLIESMLSNGGLSDPAIRQKNDAHCPYRVTYTADETGKIVADFCSQVLPVHYDDLSSANKNAVTNQIKAGFKRDRHLLH